MVAINKAERGTTSGFYRAILSEEYKGTPCIFISYQRDDEKFASDVSDYILSKQIDVYFDKNDSDLKFFNQERDPQKVVNCICNGLNLSDYMLVIISPSTYKSHWVPFEVGYAYDNKKERMKILRHKGISKTLFPKYLQTKQVLEGAGALNRFLDSIRKNHKIYEDRLQKGEEIKSFAWYVNNPLNKYLDNE